MSASAVKVSHKTDAQTRSPSRGRTLRRGGLFVTGFMLMAASTWFAFRQAPRDSIDRPLTPFEWFRSPIETNAFRRLPLIEGNLRGVHALPDRRTAWIVGADELILRTIDGGRTWERQPILADGSAPAAEPRSRASRYTLSPVVLAEGLKEVAMGVVVGMCLDETGGILPGVGITLRDLNTQETIRDQSDERGYFAVELPIGAYMFTAQLPGFRSIDVEVQLVEDAGEWNMGKLVFERDAVSEYEQTKPADPGPVRRFEIEPERIKSAPKESKPEPGPEPEPPPPPPEGPAELHAVQFIDAEVGFAVGSASTVLSTSDGGASWFHRDPSGADRLVALCFIDASRGWVASDDGSILFTETGGRTWQRQYTGAEALSAIEFVDEQTGWVLSDAGVGLLVTLNGGITWTWVALPEGRQFAAFDFVDRDHGWAVGAGGAIFLTQDAGIHWEPRDSGTDSDLLDVHFRNPSDGWAVGREGTILVTDTGGRQWRAVSSSSVKTLRSIHFANASTGWAVGDDAVLRTVDGGGTWHRQARVHEPEAHWFFPEPSHGFAVGSRGETLTTDDGGNTWRSRGESLERIRAIDFSSSERWWVLDGNSAEETLKRSDDLGRTWYVETTAGAGRTKRFTQLRFISETSGFALAGNELFQTKDGGKTWERNTSLTSPEDLVSIGFTDDSLGWIVSVAGDVYGSDDGGANWSRRANAGTGNIREAQFVDAGNGCLLEDAGADGSVLHSTADGGVSWVSSPSRIRIHSVFVEANGRRWAVGANGTILLSRDAGGSWTPSPSGVEQDLTSVHFVDPNLGFVTGLGNTFLKTRDGGESWEDAAPYQRAPAPWFYGSLLAAGVLFLLPAFKSSAPAAPRRSSVADVFVSDKPVDSAAADRLAFNELAGGLFSFLRNENTTPPMTLAVTGAWGTGKSSLMHLLRSQLRRFGFRPVWFNAWHHQKGNQLLAGLLENIRLQAVPAWWRPDGLAFRMRLVFIRGWRHCLPIIFMLLVFSVSAGYILAQGPHEVQNDLRALLARLVAMFSTSSAPVDADGSHFLPFLISSLTLLATTWKGFTAFSAAPGKLVASLTAGLRMKDVQLAHGFRHQFAQEFQDVTEAFAPRRMVIFIDDLDRCAPENVLEALEAVNFLVSSGECFVVLGMAMEQVEHCVGVALEKRGQTPEETETTVNDGGYARFYMEKLINIEVPIPTLTSEQSSVLLSPEAPVDEKRGGLVSSWLTSGLTPAVRRWVPALSLLAVSVVGFWWGTTRESPTPPATVLSSALQDVNPVPVIVRAPSTPPTGNSDVVFDQVRPVSFLPGAQAQTVSWRLPLFGAVALLALGVWKLSQPPAIIIKDSPTFAAALRFWSPLVYASRQTPRGIKRYLNRVRYYEMLQRPASPFASRWGQLLHWLAGPSDIPQEDAIPEDVLVALAAVELIRPQGLRDALLWTDFSAFLRQAMEPGTSLPPDIDDHLERIVAGWPSLGRYRESFLKLTLGVHVG